MDRATWYGFMEMGAPATIWSFVSLQRVTTEFLLLDFQHSHPFLTDSTGRDPLQWQHQFPATFQAEDLLRQMLQEIFSPQEILQIQKTSTPGQDYPILRLFPPMFIL